MKRNMWFVDHQSAEVENKYLMSPTNPYEREMIVSLCKYLLS